MKDLVFVCCVPDDLHMAWQAEVFIENYLKMGYPYEVHMVLFQPFSRIKTGKNSHWLLLQQRYANTNIKIFWYEDTENLERLLGVLGYIPLLRPFTLARHFKAHPELKDKAIFYADQDIIFLKKLDFTPFLSDDICYLSDTKSYMNSDYFDSKTKDVRPELLEAYKKRDILNEIASYAGITRARCEKNKNKTGGAQYLLKNIDHTFWEKVAEVCSVIRIHLSNANQQFMRGATKEEREINGFQAWCADMWAVLYTLWATNHETETPKELDFAWQDTPTEKLDSFYIYHNSGTRTGYEILPDGTTVEHKLFHKNETPYINNSKTPFQDDLSWVSSKFATKIYVDEIQSVRDKYYIH